MRRLALAMLLPLAACSGGAATDGLEVQSYASLADFQAQAGSGSEIGQKMADFELKGCAGDTVKLSERFYDKKLLLLDFGAGWCQPCRELQPTLKALEEKYRDQGLLVVGVLRDADQPSDPAGKTFCEGWKTQYQLPFDVLIDPTNLVSQKYLPPGAVFPVTMLVDHGWTIRTKEVGKAATDLEADIQELLGL